ncbi:tectonin domain-containing protein [Kiloniella sp.]|uniref:tectonin domain-containing protein n=1 Tax=Kiloniella sp. TaxID=1938587 RepID=UPI003A92E722
MKRTLSVVFLRFFFTFLMFFSASTTSFAQSQKDTWFSVPGRAIDLSINSEGQGYALGMDGAVWRWDKVEQRWRTMSGHFMRISAAEGNRPWAIDKDGNVHRYNGLWWELKSTKVLDVAADALANVYIVKQDGRIQKWYALRSEWHDIPGDAVRITVAADQNLWRIAQDGSVQVLKDGAWINHFGQAIDIATGPDGKVAIVTPEGNIRLLNIQNKSWDLIGQTQGVSSVAITPQGGLWALQRDGRIWVDKELKPEGTTKIDQKVQEINAPSITVSTNSAPSQSAPSQTAPSQSALVESAASITPPQVTTSPQSETTGTAGSHPQLASVIDPATISGPTDFMFVNTRKLASFLSIGRDGSIFGLDEFGNVLRWSNRRKSFENFPGSLARIAVDPEGNPWGISVLGRVFRHDGRDWQQIRNAAASDIAIGGDSSVIIANSSGVLFKFRAEEKRFERIFGNGVLVAVDPDGHPWTIRNDKLVQRCGENSCDVLGQKANSLSIGPDGRVWIVSNTARLMRFDEEVGRFIIVPTLGMEVKDVASGPFGYPWVATDDNIVLSSQFFTREEEQDLRVAATTSDETVGTGVTDTPISNQVAGFTFVKNMRFETLGLGDLNPMDVVYLDIGNDGKVYAADQTGQFTRFQETSKSFQRQDTQIGNIGYEFSDFAVDSKGGIWVYINDLQKAKVGLFREIGGTLKEYTVSGGINSGVAIAPDDTVFAIFAFSGGKSYLYKKQPSSQTFLRFSTYSLVNDVSVGTGEDVWIINKSNEVMQWTGQRFEKRPFSGQSASQINIGSEGSVYIVDLANKLYKWNGANNSFDRVNNIILDTVAVDDTGRPWVGSVDTTTIKRGKE